MAGQLVASGITVRFSGVTANDGVDVEVHPGEVVGLIGPNGAGKTTFFNIVTGFVQPTEGQVVFNGTDVTRVSPVERAALGMARTFQQSKLFPHLSVRENLLLGRNLAYGVPAWRSALRTPAARRAEAGARAYVDDLACELRVSDVLDGRVDELPYATRRWVEVARALALDPLLLLLDEPGAGMDTAESADFGRILREAQRRRDLSILLIEHDVALVLDVCDRVYVLDFGKVIASGTPDQIRADDAVRRAWLGSATQGVGAGA
ncbi:MAG: ABC transporter ATP-binding protein [Actinomycetota bacterium]|nr:ABC transporter ATP-binding protein [Actinomycetota bacterium]